MKKLIFTLLFFWGYFLSCQDKALTDLSCALNDLAKQESESEDEDFFTEKELKKQPKEKSGAKNLIALAKILEKTTNDEAVLSAVKNSPNVLAGLVAHPNFAKNISNSDYMSYVLDTYSGAIKGVEDFFVGISDTGWKTDYEKEDNMLDLFLDIEKDLTKNNAIRNILNSNQSYKQKSDAIIELVKNG